MYKKYIELYEQKTIEDTESIKLLKNKYFRNHLIEKYGINYNTIKLLSSNINNVLKPQRLLIDNIDYYVAVDMFTNTYYICYNNILMMDIDDKNITLENLIELCENHKELLFRIYSTTNGYHIFISNKLYDNKSEEAIDMMIKYNC